jgi:hypothetical protein
MIKKSRVSKIENHKVDQQHVNLLSYIKLSTTNIFTSNSQASILPSSFGIFMAAHSFEKIISLARQLVNYSS